MTNLILLVSDADSAGQELRPALTRTAPECRLEIVAGRSEIEALRTPSLILLDLMLSREPAFDILRWLRIEQRFKKVPVFAFAPPHVDVNDAYALGANSCFLREPAAGLEPIASGLAAYASLVAKSC